VIEPLRLTFDVDCSADHAFATWTSRIDTWWPADHTASGEPSAVIVLEPALGGRLFERASGGVEHDWGRVTLWEPPRRFAYTWHLRRSAEDATDVEITFTELDPGRARVEIRHSGWERLGAEGQTWRDRNSGGWRTLLPHFTAAAERKEGTP
jgi:uncharacterized protein YndB with AHSA1/START domain